MMLMDIIRDEAAVILFAVVVSVLYGVLLLTILFCGLAVRAAWRWLTCATWRDVVLLVHRRALR